MKYSIEIIRIVAVVLITFTHTRRTIDSGPSLFFIEHLPRIGTLLLSIISGYLFIKVSCRKQNFYLTKIKTLFIPFLIANFSVLLLVCIAWYFFDYTYLNRLSFTPEIILNGLLSLSEPPINPPTYFIRDIFVIFTLIELVKNRNYWTLLIIIPLLLFGKIFIRFDIVYLFVFGGLFCKYENLIMKYKEPLILILLLISLFAVFYTSINTYRYPLAILLFVSTININVPFFNVGAFSYLLHLYHSPIIVVAYPMLRGVVDNQVLNVVLQVMISIFCVAVLYFFTRRFKILRIICGGK